MALFAFAFLAGIATALSPCILPILPIVLGSAASKNKGRPLALVLGLIISFSFFTLTVSKLVDLLGLSPYTLRIVAVLILGILGLLMSFPKLGERWEVLISGLTRYVPQKEKDGWLGGFVAGATLGLVWTPCAGPILAAVTVLVASEKISLSVIAILLCYSAGAGVPLLAVAYGGRSVMSRVPQLSKYSTSIRKFFGFLTIATAMVMGLGLDATLAARASSFLPDFVTSRINALQSSENVQKALNEVTQSGAQTASTETAIGALQDLGPAPEFAGITNWLNSPPLTLSQLKGKVVLVDFWTYSCINCLRTLPYVKSWYAKYKDLGFVVVGVHSPEFAFEKDASNVAKALTQNEIQYPVAQDNNYGTWQAYQNHYWPAHYFIDATGKIRHTHFGEGGYEESEEIIKQLLAEAGNKKLPATSKTNEFKVSHADTPETYLGLARQERFASAKGKTTSDGDLYSLPPTLELNSFAVAGPWMFDQESATAMENASLQFHFHAKDVYLVMSSPQPLPVRVRLLSESKNSSEEVNKDSVIQVESSKLYHLLSLDSASDETLELQFPKSGVVLYAFTFG